MDNIPKYIAVKEGREPADYLHPKLRPMLEETYGIMVYQEQVMQAAQILAGYSLGAADLLRRAMGKKIKSEMDAQRDLFIKGAKDHSNVPKDQALHIFEQIEKFAGYGFNKSHAAAYALIAYQTAWLKTHYPVEFMAASMTLDMGNTDKLAVFKQALDQMGIALLPPDINKSSVTFAVEGTAVRYALAAMKGVGEAAMKSVIEDRKVKGDFKSLDDFLQRIDAKSFNKKQFENLVAGGAFDTLHANRASLFVSAESLVHFAASQAQERASAQNSLFSLEPQLADNACGHLIASIPDWNPLERLSYEFQAIGFYLSSHPLDTKKRQLERMNIIPMAQAELALEGRASMRVQMAGVLIRKSEKVSQKNGSRFAFLTMSDATGVYEVTAFSECYARARGLLEEGKSYLLSVDLEKRDDQMRFNAQDIRLLDETLTDRLLEVSIELEGVQGIESLHKLLRPVGKDGVKISLFLKDQKQRQVKIGLSDLYHFSPETRGLLYQIPQVKKISEL
jgi:DNA polymerase-3 subunit alpha